MFSGLSRGSVGTMGRCRDPALAGPAARSLSPQGASANWWNHRHFQHHAKPNIFSKDPDVNMLHVFVLGEWQPVEVAQGAVRAGQQQDWGTLDTAVSGVQGKAPSLPLRA